MAQLGLPSAWLAQGRRTLTEDRLLILNTTLLPDLENPAS